MEVKIEGIIKYDNRLILRPQKIRLEPGLNCLIGPSGIGKTTLLKTILKSIKSDVSYLPQELTLPPYVTPKKLALYIASRNKCSTKMTYLTRFENYTKILGIKEMLDKPFGKLSAGEKERILLAITLARGCKLFLADEPEKYLDPRNIDVAMALIKIGTDTALVAVHNPLVFPFCERFYSIFNGVVKETLPQDVLGISFKEIKSCKLICPSSPSSSETSTSKPIPNR